jgi:hypothetical protein
MSKADTTRGEQRNPTFGDYTHPLDEPRRELLKAAFRERAGEVHDEHLRALYAALEAALGLAAGVDIDMAGMCAGLPPATIAGEKLHWGARVVEPRNDDAVSRLYAHLVLRFIQAEHFAKKRLHRRHEIN